MSYPRRVFGTRRWSGREHSVVFCWLGFWATLDVYISIFLSLFPFLSIKRVLLGCHTLFASWNMRILTCRPEGQNDYRLLRWHFQNIYLVIHLRPIESADRPDNWSEVLANTNARLSANRLLARLISAYDRSRASYSPKIMQTELGNSICITLWLSPQYCT